MAVPDENSKGILFSRNKIKKTIIYFIVLVITIKLVFFLLFLAFQYYGTNPLPWPLGEFFLFFNPFVFDIEIIIWRVLMTPVIIIVFIKFKKLLLEKHLGLIVILTLAILLMVSLNLLNGIRLGLETPFTHHYTAYSELKDIDDIFAFIAGFETYQLTGGNLQYITHPIGAKLFFFILYKVLFYPALMSIATCVISTVISGFFMYGIIQRIVDTDKVSIYITFIFLIMPATQIFYLANLYAIVCTTFLGVLFFYFHSDRKIRLIGTAIFLIFSAALTFMFVFILLFIFIDTFFIQRDKKRILDFLILVVSLGLIYLITLLALNYDYINSFLITSEIENPQGFRLLADPLDYVFTRIEDILEILIFFGPFLLILFWRSMPLLKKKGFNTLYHQVLSAVLILLGLFLLGVYRTGETARAANYIFIFFLIPISIYFKENYFPKEEYNNLFALVFIQTFIMQILGWYVW